MGLDNQQATQDLIWLAGIIDGEGCIAVAPVNRKQKTNGMKCVRLQIGSITPQIIERVSVIWSRLGAVFGVSLYRPKARPEHQSLTIQIRTQGSLKKVLDAVLPYLVAKREEAEAMLEFITYRKSIPDRLHRVDSRRAEIAAAYTRLDEQLKALHRRRWNLHQLSRKASRPLDLSNLKVLNDSEWNALRFGAMI